MFESNGNGERVSRRGFLRGTAVFAATMGMAALPAAAQQQEPAPGGRDGAQSDAPKQDEDNKTESGQPKKKLVDKDGREYRICDMCGGNMYKQEKTWTCEQCGFAYDE